MAIRNYTVIGGLGELEQCGISDASDSSAPHRSSRGFTTTPVYLSEGLVTTSDLEECRESSRLEERY